MSKIRTISAGHLQTDGLLIGEATDKLGLFGKAPIVRRDSASQAVVTGAAGANPTQAEYAAMVVLVNELRNTLVAYGLIKGAA